MLLEVAIGEHRLALGTIVEAFPLVTRPQRRDVTSGLRLRVADRDREQALLVRPTGAGHHAVERIATRLWPALLERATTVLDTAQSCADVGIALRDRPRRRDVAAEDEPLQHGPR